MRAIKATVFSLATVALLAGCVPSEPFVLPKETSFYSDFKREVFVVETAKLLAKQCGSSSGFIGPGTLRFDWMRESGMRQALLHKARAQGVTPEGVRHFVNNIDKAKIQRDLFAYIEKRKLVFGEPQTFCDAGEKEIAMKSAVGAYLQTR